MKYCLHSFFLHVALSQLNGDSSESSGSGDVEQNTKKTASNSTITGDDDQTTDQHTKLVNQTDGEILLSFSREGISKLPLRGNYRQNVNISAWPSAFRHIDQRSVPVVKRTMQQICAKGKEEKCNRTRVSIGLCLIL